MADTVSVRDQPVVTLVPARTAPTTRGRARMLEYFGISGFGMAVGSHVGKYGWAIGGLVFPVWWRLTGGKQ